jgi:hypothetical protein
MKRKKHGPCLQTACGFLTIEIIVATNTALPERNRNYGFP